MTQSGSMTHNVQILVCLVQIETLEVLRKARCLVRHRHRSEDYRIDEYQQYGDRDWRELERIR